jgi:hypothetical protein
MHNHGGVGPREGPRNFVAGFPGALNRGRGCGCCLALALELKLPLAVALASPLPAAYCLLTAYMRGRLAL